jgi:hypothetical protein
VINNPTGLRQQLKAIFEASPLTVGGQTFGQDVTDEAIEEIIGAMVRSYMQEGGPTACEKIVGAFFLGLIERSTK